MKDSLERFLHDVLHEMGFALYDAQLVQKNRVLRIYMDKPGGVDINDCEAACREIGARLDRTDFFDESYVLEVGSPGVERRLRKREHFQASIGSRIKLRLANALEVPNEPARKQFTGTLDNVSDDTITLVCDTGQFQFAIAEIASCRLVVF